MEERLSQIVAFGGGGFSMDAGNPLLDQYVLGLTGVRPTQQVCVDLYEWAVIVPLRRNEAAA